MVSRSHPHFDLTTYTMPSTVNTCNFISHFRGFFFFFWLHDMATLSDHMLVALAAIRTRFMSEVPECECKCELFV